MKLNVLAAVAHNLAASMSGCSFLTRCYGLNPFADAARSPGRLIELDLLTGRCTRGEPSPELVIAAQIAAAQALPKLCEQEGGSASEFRALTVRYHSDPIEPWFEVELEDAAGRRRSDRYRVWGARPKVLDELGRIRTRRRGFRIRSGR